MYQAEQKTISFLARLAEGGMLPHSFLFTGPDRIGKKRVVVKFAKYLLHGNARERGADPFKEKCGCNSCVSIDNATHPDFYSHKGFSLQIRQTRHLKEKLHLSSFYEGRKVVVIDGADELRKEASNSLLKLLEEPRGDAILMLLAPSRASVLKTIASRAVEIRVAPRKVWYKKFFDKKNITRQIDIFENLPLNDKMREARMYDLKNKNELIELLDAWLAKLREALLSGYKQKDLNLVKEILRAKRFVSETNASPQIILEELCVKRL